MSVSSPDATFFYAKTVVDRDLEVRVVVNANRQSFRLCSFVYLQARIAYASLLMCEKMGMSSQQNKENCEESLALLRLKLGYDEGVDVYDMVRDDITSSALSFRFNPDAPRVGHSFVYSPSATTLLC
ncbi:unnamed protein product [Nippostrongylus brasiliensis]|uniref:FERM domain-containing protein n=1 Tax=Nippostrongylus brasiliensis TaxID=27835 RepID=A0A0N4YMT9_NIPBR|nr:unnamed protein product [Nippostrongylus brasiliensis]